MTFLSSLGEAGLESPGSTCPGAETSQVDPTTSDFDLSVETFDRCSTCGVWMQENSECLPMFHWQSGATAQFST